MVDSDSILFGSAIHALPGILWAPRRDRDSVRLGLLGQKFSDFLSDNPIFHGYHIIHGHANCSSDIPLSMKLIETRRQPVNLNSAYDYDSDSHRICYLFVMTVRDLEKAKI